ncbi:MAG: type II secretion system F family protein [Chloroflexi bacterium]|nr:type II secretion system F family protein [Chloroflexota bacterium]
MIQRLNKQALAWFGGYAGWGIRRADLFKAHLYVPVEKYLSMAIFYSLAFAPLPLSLWMVAEGLAYPPHVLLDVAARRLSLPVDHPVNIVTNILMVFLALILGFSLVFIIFYYYPQVKAWERARVIDAQLPYAIAWMSSMATVGVIPYTIFKKLADAQEYYGEVSMEAKQVVRDVDLLGFDFITALRNLTATTPSLRLRTFIQGAVTSTLSGTEMGHYFMSKARANLEENRRQFADFINTLGIVSEMYITGLVAGPLFIIVMFSAMAMLSGTSPVMLMAIIYGMIPLGSIGFFYLIDSLTPAGSK